MPISLDVHKMHGFDEEILRKTENSAKDEFVVTHRDILYNEEEDKLFCILDAPDRNAVGKHHEKFGINCDWITEIRSVD